MSPAVPSSRCVECGAMCWDLAQHEAWHDGWHLALQRLAENVESLARQAAANDLHLGDGIRRLHGLIMGRPL